MAQNGSRIENLPSDALKEIIVRVAGPPQGATDVARTFAVSKRFKKFVEDEEVLRAVSFKNCAPFCDGLGIRNLDVVSHYEKFQQLGGLLVRCAEAGNPEAEFMLAKVVMVSTSKLLNVEKVKKVAKAEAPLWCARIFRSKDYNKIKLTEARSLVEHFSPVTSSEIVCPDNLVHFDLVSNFLSEAKAVDVCEMIQYLKDYVAYNLEPGKEAAYKQFLTTLDEVWVSECSRLARTSDHQLALYVDNALAVCNIAYTVFQNYGIFEEEQLRPLQQTLLQINDQVTPETLLESWSIVIPMLQLAGPLVSHRCYEERTLISNIHQVALALRGYLRDFFLNMEFLQNAHYTLTSDFYDIFYSN